jgi:hypothetical protein
MQLDFASLGDKTTGAAVFAKILLESLLASQAEVRSGFTGGDSGEKPKLEQSRGWGPTNALWAEVKVGSRRWGRYWRLSRRQWAGNENKPIEFGESQEEAHERHQQHV